MMYDKMNDRIPQHIEPIMANDRIPSFDYVPYVEPTGRSFSPRQIFRIWRRHLRISLVFFIATLILGMAVILMLKPTYTATAVVAISLQNADPLAPSGQQSADGSEDDDLPATEAAMMMSRDVAASVLAQIPPEAQAPGFTIKNLLWLRVAGFQQPLPGPPAAQPGGETAGRN